MNTIEFRIFDIRFFINEAGNFHYSFQNADISVTLTRGSPYVTDDNESVVAPVGVDRECPHMPSNIRQKLTKTETSPHFYFMPLF